MDLYLKCLIAHLNKDFVGSLYCKAGWPCATFKGEGMRTDRTWANIVEKFGISDGFTGSISFTYYSSEAPDSLSDDDKERVKKWNGDEGDNWCLCKVFLNGELQGWTLDSLSGFKNGLEIYDGKKGDFYIGIAPSLADSCLYLFNGSMKTIRVYNRGISDTEVRENYSKFNKYIASFAN